LLLVSLSKKKKQQGGGQVLRALKVAKVKLKIKFARKERSRMMYQQRQADVTSRCANHEKAS